MKDKSINNIIKELEEPIKNLNKINIERLKNIKVTIKYILDNNIINQKIIERIFDELLDLTYFYGNDLYEIYFQLLSYYESIDKKSCNDYKNIYLELINEL